MMQEKLNVSRLLFIMLYVNAILLFYQLMLTPAQLMSWNDGTYYLKMAEGFISGQFTQIKFPFSQRILAPYIAAALPFKSVDASFSLINWISVNMALLTLTAFWQKLKVPAHLLIFGVSWILFNPLGTQLYFHYIINTDVMGYLFSAWLIAVILSRKYGYLLFVAPLSVLERENVICSFVIVLFCEIIHFSKTGEKRPLLLSLLALVLAIYANYLTRTHWFYGAPGSSFATLKHFMLLRLAHPMDFIKWLSAVMLAVGGIPVLLKDFNFALLRDTKMLILSLISLSYVAFGLLAGTDMTRIIFDGVPYLLTLAFYCLSVNRVFALDRMLLLYIFSGFSLAIGYSLAPNFIDYIKPKLGVFQVFFTLLVGYMVIDYFVRRFFGNCSAHPGSNLTIST